MSITQKIRAELQTNFFEILFDLSAVHKNSPPNANEIKRFCCVFLSFVWRDSTRCECEKEKPIRLINCLFINHVLICCVYGALKCGEIFHPNRWSTKSRAGITVVRHRFLVRDEKWQIKSKRSPPPKQSSWTGEHKAFSRKRPLKLL